MNEWIRPCWSLLLVTNSQKSAKKGLEISQKIAKRAKKHLKYQISYLFQNDGLNESFNSILLTFVIGNIIRIFGRELDFQLVSLFFTRGLSPKPQAYILVSKGIRIAWWSPIKENVKIVKSSSKTCCQVTL